MLECLILGDSIAVGTHMARPECAVVAKGGINSWQFNKNYPGEFYSNVVIISLGSNDHKHIRTRKELENLRERVVAKSRVYWILPHGNLKAGGVDIADIQQIVEDIANKHSDWIIKIPYISPDGIHPTGRGYKKIAEITK